MIYMPQTTRTILDQNTRLIRSARASPGYPSLSPRLSKRTPTKAWGKSRKCATAGEKSSVLSRRSGNKSYVLQRRHLLTVPLMAPLKAPIVTKTAILPTILCGVSWRRKKREGTTTPRKLSRQPAGTLWPAETLSPRPASASGGNIKWFSYLI